MVVLQPVHYTVDNPILVTIQGASSLAKRPPGSGPPGSLTHKKTPEFVRSSQLGHHENYRLRASTLKTSFTKSDMWWAFRPRRERGSEVATKLFKAPWRVSVGRSLKTFRSQVDIGLQFCEQQSNCFSLKTCPRCSPRFEIRTMSE